MATYQNIDNPEHVAFFARHTNRTLWGLLLVYLIEWPIVFAIGPTDPRTHGLVIVFLLCLFFGLCTLASRPIRMFRMRRAMGLAPGVRPVLPYPISLRYTLARTDFGFIPIAPLFAINSDPLQAASTLIALPVFGLGLLLCTCWKLRQPAPISCPTCAYPVDPPVFPAVCAECATAMPTEQGATRMPIVKRPAFLWLGASLMLFAFVVFFGPAFNPGIASKALPRRTQITLAATESRILNALDLTALTPAERDRLTDAILDARARGEYVHQQLIWIGTRLASGDLDPQRTQRFLIADASPTIITRPHPDGRTELSILAGIPRNTWNTFNTGYFFAGFELDPAPADDPPGQALGRSPSLHPGYELGRTFAQRDEEQSRQAAPAGNQSPPSVLASIHQPTTVRARVIFIPHDPNTVPAPTITWHDDGTHTITPQPLAVYERTAETVIKPTP